MAKQIKPAYLVAEELAAIAMPELLEGEPASRPVGRPKKAAL
jgi:hypothetical protein